MIIRAVKREDADRIGQLWLELMDYHRQLSELMPIPAPEGSQRYASRIRWSVDDNHVQTYVAEDAGQLIGYVYGTVVELLPEMFIDERAGIVGDIYVSSSYRSQGVGTALMQAMKDWFQLREVSHYELYVAAMNESGLRFWEKTMGGKAVMVRMRASVER